MSNWLINATKKWVIDPVTNKWKIGTGGDPCCFRQFNLCTGNTPTNFWMTETNALTVASFKRQNVCYGRSSVGVSCLPSGATLLTPAQVQVFGSCALCAGPPPVCPRCSMSMIRASFNGMGGACCAPWNGIFDLPVKPPTSADLCFFELIIGTMPAGCPSVAQGTNVIARVFTESSDHIGVSISNSSTGGLYGGDSFTAANLQSLCNGSPITFDVIPTGNTFGFITCADGPTGTVTLSKVA